MDGQLRLGMRSCARVIVPFAGSTFRTTPVLLWTCACAGFAASAAFASACLV
jgi:hypothetical protein